MIMLAIFLERLTRISRRRGDSVSLLLASFVFTSFSRLIYPNQQFIISEPQNPPIEFQGRVDWRSSGGSGIAKCWDWSIAYSSMWFRRSRCRWWGSCLAPAWKGWPRTCTPCRCRTTRNPWTRRWQPGAGNEKKKEKKMSKSKYINSIYCRIKQQQEFKTLYQIL